MDEKLIDLVRKCEELFITCQIRNTATEKTVCYRLA